MKTILLTLLLVPIISFGQNKKKQIEALNFSLDSLNNVLTTTRDNSIKEINLLKTNIDSLNNFIDYENKKNTKEKEFLNNQINSLNKKEKLLNKKIDSLNSFLVKLSNENNILGLNIDSLKLELTTSTNKGVLQLIKRSRNSTNFKSFLFSFVVEVGSLDNFSEQYANSSEIIAKYTNSKFGTGYYSNPGALCYLFKDIEFDNMVIIDLKNYMNLPLYNEKVVDGFCEPSKQEDGLYYNKINRLPPHYDEEFRKIDQPFEDYNKMSINFLKDDYINFTLYFIQDNDKKWYLTYIDNCDCSG